jgi:hypothetical protein
MRKGRKQCKNKTQKKTEISEELVAETVNKFLNGKLGFFSRKGSRLIYMAATMQGRYESFVSLPKGGPTKVNIIALIGREIARKIGVEPRKDKETYNIIKNNIRGKVGKFIRNNPQANTKLENIMKQKKFRAAEWIGRRPKIGKFLGKTSLRLRKARNLSAGTINNSHHAK